MGKYKGEKAANLLKQDTIRIEQLEHMPASPTTRATTRAVFDDAHAQRNKLQLAEMCAVFRGSIPKFPKACDRFSPKGAASFAPSKSPHPEKDK